jgi:H+/Cl- antiporter ClcA
MKRAVIGGFLSLIGTIWGLAVILFAANNLVSGWSTPPGRLLTTISETAMTFPLVISIVFLAVGLLIMIVEYFKKGE